MIILKTPLRISLFGGGTDFPSYFIENGGCVLTTAINKYVYVIIKQRFDNNLRLGYSVTENVTDVADLKHELAREAIKKFNVSGIEISTMADVPGGTGLGSSSAVTVGLLHALHTYVEELPTKKELAKEAIDIEINKLSKPIGYQDQIIAAYGGFKKIEFGWIDDFNIIKPNISNNILKELNDNLMLWYTNGIRYSSDILNEQNNNVHKNKELLNSIGRICLDAESELINGNINSIGYLLDESWSIKKQLASKISSNDIDILYDYAKEHGAIGGKVCGAGGGGFLLTYVPIHMQSVLRLTMKEIGILEFPFEFEPDGSKVIFDYR